MLIKNRKSKCKICGKSCIGVNELCAKCYRRSPKFLKFGRYYKTVRTGPDKIKVKTFDKNAYGVYAAEKIPIDILYEEKCF